MDPVIDVTNLTCRYRRAEAVRGISFTVQPGTVFALLGPNGAGKTTTIRALMNIVRPSGGKARVLGVDSRHLGPREFEGIGYVSENQQIPHWMTLAAAELFESPERWSPMIALTEEQFVRHRGRTGRLDADIYVHFMQTRQTGCSR